MDKTTPKPRKKYTRQPGAVRPPGRPAMGRTVNLPRVTPEIHTLASNYASQNRITLAEAVGRAIIRLWD